MSALPAEWSADTPVPGFDTPGGDPARFRFRRPAAVRPPSPATVTGPRASGVQGDAGGPAVGAAVGLREPARVAEPPARGDRGDRDPGRGVGFAEVVMGPGQPDLPQVGGR